VGAGGWGEWVREWGVGAGILMRASMYEKTEC